MKYLKNIIISLIGVLFFMSSCEDKLPFPEAERATFVTIENVSGFTTVSAAADPASIQFSVAVRLHEFGGTEYEKVEIAVVRNPAPTAANPAYQTAVLRTIESGLNLETPVTVTFTLAEVIAGAGIISGQPYGFYYNVIMPDGSRTDGWLPPPTLFTARFAINPIMGSRTEHSSRVHNFNISVTP